MPTLTLAVDGLIARSRTYGVTIRYLWPSPRPGLSQIRRSSSHLLSEHDHRSSVYRGTHMSKVPARFSTIGRPPRLAALVYQRPPQAMRIPLRARRAVIVPEPAQPLRCSRGLHRAAVLEHSAHTELQDGRLRPFAREPRARNDRRIHPAQRPSNGHFARRSLSTSSCSPA